MILVIVFQKEREKAFDDEHEECRMSKKKEKKSKKTKKIKNFLSKVSESK